ncbi:MAG: phosphotransferase [Reyranellaceae bacterium]
MSEEEIPLAGGRVTTGVVRIGDTVRRPMASDRTLQQDFLRFLQARGFAGAPRFLGRDEKGREILSFLPGQVPDDLGHYEDGQLAAAARLLRAFHDAGSGFAAAAAAGAETMCHNDWGPPNAVFRDGLPWAMIDFDTLQPGARLWDLGYSAFAWLDLGNEDYAGAEQGRRLQLFAAAYDRIDCDAAAIAAYAVARQTALAVWATARGQTAMVDWARRCAAWTVRHLLERLNPTGFPR